MANKVDDFTVVLADKQTSGKGQMGAVWDSNCSENLTFSVYLSTSFISLQNQFYLNCVVAISLYNLLKNLSIPNVFIKWPNDILASSKKVSGVLIENVVKSNNNSFAIIGVGLNINQHFFPDLFKATSLKNITGIDYDLNKILILFISELKSQVVKLSQGRFKEIHNSYESVLFRKDKPSTFKNAEGLMFPGIIKGVNNTGLLLVYTEDEIIKEFQLKELSLLY